MCCFFKLLIKGQNQGTINDNSNEVVLHNGLTLKEFPLPSGSRPPDVAPSLLDNDVSGILLKPKGSSAS